jgi:predicted DCC family thiol-disulfide oxidoreductase YuxK
MFKSSYIVFYDGHCVLCNRVVRWILKHDQKDVFRFAPLQGATANAFFKERNFDGVDLDTVILWRPEKAYWTKSTAFFEIIKQLSVAWRWLLFFSFFPKKITDWGYTIIAKNRMKWFGQYDHCPIPEPHLKHKFLD